MSFIAVAIALLIEQLKPLPRENPVHGAMAAWMRWAGHNFNAGRDHHAVVVWIVTVPLPALLAFAIHAALSSIGIALALAWDVAILYLTLGFRQFSHYFTDIQEALERGDELRARSLLQEWRGLDASDLPRDELLRHTIEHALLAAHRHVFGVFFWYVLLAVLGCGPAGAVLYRLAEFASRHWAHRARRAGLAQEDRLTQLSASAFNTIDHVPARLTASGFAIVGNFEDAVNGMRQHAALWGGTNEGMILAAAAGAVGVRLGGAAQTGQGAVAAEAHTSDGDAELDSHSSAGSTAGARPHVGHLRSLVGLVWRSVVLWMLLLALWSLARWVG
jgi:adenosylcobinamide-phosphate synthase